MQKKPVIGAILVAAVLAAVLVWGQGRGWFTLEPPAGHDRLLEHPVLLDDVDGAQLHVAVAATEEQRALGLNRVPEMEWGQGMLFVFDETGKHTIDISGHLIAVDVLWLDSSRLILGSDKEKKPSVFVRTLQAPSERARYAVMMNGGWIEAHGTHRNVVVTTEDAALPAFATHDLPPQERPTIRPTAPIELLGDLPPKVVHNVPFVPQAPFGDWNDIRQANACEESSALMAVRWARGEDIGYREAERVFLDASAWQDERFGYFHDTSAQDTAQRIVREYYGHNAVEVFYDISVNDIRRALAEGSVVVVPADGRILNNPYFTPPGPPVHMLTVIGYDDAAEEFITNDPGTRSGAGFRYSYQNLMTAIADYESGYHEAGSRLRTAMLVISPEG